MRMVNVIALAALGAVATQAGAATTVYSNDFNDGTAANFTMTGLQGSSSQLNSAGVYTSADQSQSFIGLLTMGATATLNLSGLAAHSSVTVSFDVYGFKSLDYPADHFTFDSGTGYVLNSSYGYNFNGTPDGASSVSSDSTAFGEGCYYGCVVIGHYELTFSHASADMVLKFIGNADQGYTDESFGLDNVVVTTDAVAGAVPEPASWALMIVGFGAIGAGLRRRKAAVRFA